MLMCTGQVADGGKAICQTNIILKSVALFAFVMKPAEYIPYAFTPKSSSKSCCQFGDILPMVFNRLNNGRRPWLNMCYHLVLKNLCNTKIVIVDKYCNILS